MPTAPVVVPAGVGPSEQPGTDESSGTGTDGYGGYSRTHFTLGSLTPAPGGAPTHAPGFGYDPRSVYSAETVARLAGVLGVSGDAVNDGWQWRVGAVDSSGPDVRLNMDPFAIFWYFNPVAYVGWCDPSQGTCASVPAGPSADEATSAMRAVMTGAGVDLDGYTFTASTEGVGNTRVTAVPPGHKLEDYSSRSWEAVYTAKGLSSLGGSVAPRVSLGEYALVSPAVAVGRLSDTRFTPTWWAGAPEGAMESGQGEVTNPPAAPAAGSKIPWDVQEAVITTWELTTATFYGPDRAAYDLPAYRLGTGTGYFWTVLAVADKHLAF
ncbi:MAG TPA: hypothetical protein VGK35_07445 [Actinotalea sp.]